MLNYANLNDMEFEALCRDIMERKLGVSLRRFAPGKDGGVDLTDDVATKNIVVQVKHYQKSGADALIRSLKNERPKVDKLQPKEYFICCSTELSQSRIDEVYRYFAPYMVSDRHIITILEIDDFLKNPDNRDILKKHFKLWLDSTGILEELFNDDIFVDCEALLSDVDALQKLFVRTGAFDRALKVLESNQPLCIIGDPGVGKSITSKMLVLHYAAQGYRVRYTTDVTDLKSLKKALRDDSAAKEIILLDDCFGQAYFEMKASQSSELIALIKYVKLHPNKVLILNSRVTIFQEARERQRDLVQCMERKEFRIQVLDMNNLSSEERAKILYNHLAFSGIPAEHFDDVRKDRRYQDIIAHRNYNPRIIEFVCSPSRYRNIPAEQFYNYIKKQLDSPQEMWADEYDDRLQQADRILLQTIYSMTATTVNANLVKHCFDRRIAGISTIDKTLSQYSRSLMRLNEGFIRILDNRGTQELSMQNPSVNDFLDSRLREDSLERQELVASICSDKQFRLLPEEDRLPYAIHLLQTNEIDQFLFAESHHRSRFIARCILSAELYIDRYRPDLYAFLLMEGGYDYHRFVSHDEKQRILTTLKNPKIWEFYGLKDFLKQPSHLYTLLRYFSLEDAVSFISTADEYFPQVDWESFVNDGDEAFEAYDDSEFFEETVTKFLEQAINDFCIANAADFEYAEDIADIEYLVENSLRSILIDLPERFSDYYWYDYPVSVIGADTLETRHTSDTEDGYSDEPEDTEDYSPIDAIFER